MKFIKLIFLFFFIINFSKEITSNDFNYIYPNKILKGVLIDFEIELNEGIEEWDNSIPIKIGDNNIPLEKCNSGYYSYYTDDNISHEINKIKCYKIILNGDNTEISYGGIVQTGTNLNISFFDEFSIINISNEYLLKDKYEYIYIKTNVAAGLNYRAVKLGNYVPNCDSYDYYLHCNVKLENEGTYTLTIDGKEYKLDEGTKNERIASITVYEYKIIELPTFSVDSIETSEILSFSLKIKHNKFVGRYPFYIGNNVNIYCYSDWIDDNHNNVNCWVTLYLKNKAKEKETQYFYYYDPIKQTNITTNISIVVTAPKTLKIKGYSVYNYGNSDRIFKDVKSKIEFRTNLNYLFDKNKDKIKIGNNELFQCNRSSSDSENIYCYGIFTESTLKKDGTYEYLNIKLNGVGTGFSTYVMVADTFTMISNIRPKYEDFYARKEEKTFILDVDSSLQIEKSQISLRNKETGNKIILSCNKTDNFYEIHCSGIVSEKGNYSVYINETYEDYCKNIYLKETPTTYHEPINLEPKAIFADKETQFVMTLDSANNLNINKFELTAKELGKLAGKVDNCKTINTFQIQCSVTFPNIGIYSLKNGNYSFGELYSTHEYMSEIYSVSPFIFYTNEENAQYLSIKVDANYDVNDHILKLVPTNSSLDNLILFCSTSYDYLYIECNTYFEETGEYTLYFDDVKQDFKIYVINKETKIISQIINITPSEINYTSSTVSFELTSDTNVGIKYHNLSLNLNGIFSYYLQCEPSADSTTKSICSTKLKTFGSFYLYSNNNNNEIYINILTNAVDVNGPEIVNITPYKFDSSANVQTFQITYSSEFGDDFYIELNGNETLNIKPKCIKLNSTDIQCSTVFPVKEIYYIYINGYYTNFKLYVGVEEEKEENNKDDENNNNESKSFITEDNNGNFYKLLSKTLGLICFILF